MILDGVVPAQLALGPALALDAERALKAVLARCTENGLDVELFHILTFT